MKKETKRLSGAERPLLTDGKKEEVDVWGDAFEKRRSGKSIGCVSKYGGRGVRISAALFIAVCVLVFCAVCFIPQNDRGNPEPIPETTEVSAEISRYESDSAQEESENIENNTENENEKNTESSALATTEVEEETKGEEIIKEGLYDFDYSSVPEGSSAIVPADLALISYGQLYVNNMTGYSPDIASLLYGELGEDGIVSLTSSDAPRVLIIHTHGTEAYTERGATFYTDKGGEFARSHDPKENVIAVGSVLADVLNRAGIPTLHSTVLHDSIQYKDAYARSAQTVKKYLETYPSIELVIDVHRDSVINSNGDIVRPVTLVEGERCAQVKCIVGSPWEETEYYSWEKNLSLALKLRYALNESYGNLCRPIDIEPTSYNQELPRYSMTIEIGASGNSLEEAMCASNAIGTTLAKIIKII